MRFICCLALAIHFPGLLSAQLDRGDFPIVPGDMEVALFARDPLVRNPCAIVFDAKGRLCVGMGPQYRNPTRETQGDSVWILIDADRDGEAESRKEFATGFNAIQGLAWKGRDLWIANAPDLTVVRDLDGDDVADEYVRVYTDLGNLEHALHGLNFGPDGKLYMSKGNSKGLTKLPDRIAPRAFRELWGVPVPEGTPDMPAPIISDREGYKKNYHDPADDWGITGGILRCDDDGSNLEIVSRGFRNPWDISFDDRFDWLGTDNDQTMGDKIFAPFFGAHFGWGHAWSYDWKGDDHLPTAPSSGPLFEGSGTGLVYCGLDRYPEKYRGVYLINDWLRRQIYIYRPTWEGALRVPVSDKFEILAHADGGRAMNESRGRAFDPVDIEIGPDGAIWIASWGREYGASYRDGEFASEGRIYRIWPKASPPEKWSEVRDPLSDLGSHLPVWRTNAQEKLIQSNDGAAMEGLLERDGIPTALETWAVWTSGRMDPQRAWFAGSLNQRIQSLRVQGTRKEVRSEVFDDLKAPQPRIRLEAVLAVRQAGGAIETSDLCDLIDGERDRIVSYALWGLMMDALAPGERKTLLVDPRAPVRRAALLGLLEQNELSDDEIRPMTDDADPLNAALARKRLGGKAPSELRGRPLTASLGKDLNREESDATDGVNPFLSVRSSSGNAYRVANLAAGVAVYSDRDYRVTGVPAELIGEAFVQTANNDADATEGIEVTLEMKYPATLFLGEDVRGEIPPTWLREGWEPTDLYLETEDPQEMRIYKREVPAGKVVLGTNRDGVKARKGNYIVIARPKLLVPDGKVATLDEVLAALPDADASRGRDLFLSQHGANCAACHQIEGIGNQHAPGLGDIGSRADAKFLIESIIRPSASITEGFVAHRVKTKSGASHVGILLGETGRSVTIAMVGGAKAVVRRDEIVVREALEISAMPAGYDVLLRTQQIADLTKFLLQQKGREAPGVEFSFVRENDDQLGVKYGDTLIATHLLDDPVLTRRAFVNVKTPGGTPVTREFPAPAAEDHTHMHPGIWLGFGWISGNDYWRMQSKVVFSKFLQHPKVEGGKASFATRNRYLDESGNEAICVEDTRYVFSGFPEGILLEVDATFFNDERDFAFGDQEESGLAVRMAKNLSVEFGQGGILNDRGERNGRGTWGKEFDWIDYSGVIGNKEVGVMLLPHPGNSRGSWSHSRDYGIVVANPFPKQPKERREPFVKTEVKKGERFRLRYAVLIHETAEDKFDAAEAAAWMLERLE